MEWFTAVMTRPHTDTLFREHICYICRMFVCNSKRPNAQHSLILRMKHSHSSIMHFRKCIIDKRQKITIACPACYVHFIEKVDSSTESNNPRNMRCTGLPTFWNTRLLIALLRNKINSSSSSHRCLPGFLEFSSQSQYSDTSICHHLVS